ncbi:MAG: four helix bundle protein [Xanthomonadales bacterium]|nr:four helix bundle protein [Xanthomonadales bacterium]
MALSVEVYRELSGLNDFGFRDQMTRSGLSVPSNSAEGYERESNKELIRFLYIAKGSCGELHTQTIIGMKIGYLKQDMATKWQQETKEISAMLGGLIKKRKAFSGAR